MELPFLHVKKRATTRAGNTLRLIRRTQRQGAAAVWIGQLHALDLPWFARPGCTRKVDLVEGDLPANKYQRRCFAVIEGGKLPRRPGEVGVVEGLVGDQPI